MLSEIENFAEKIRAAASAPQTILVDGCLENASAAINVELDSEIMLRLVAIIKPGLLYFHQEWFDYDAAIEDYLADLGAESNDNVDISPLSALKRYDKAYHRKLCLVYVGFVANSVLHFCLEKSEWYTDFQTDVEDLSAKLKTVLIENRKKSNLKLALEVKSKAEILANDPAFNYNRAGREKRTYLAEKLFPDSDWSEISQIVDEATNIDFLNKARLPDS